MTNKEKICYYVEIFDLIERIPCKSKEEAEKEAEEIIQCSNTEQIIKIAEGSEEDYKTEFGMKEELYY